MSAENEQVPGTATVPGGIAAPEILTLPAPGTALTVPAEQVVDAFAGVATTNVHPAPVGRLSVRAAAVCGTLDLFDSVTVKRVRPPAAPTT